MTREETIKVIGIITTAYPNFDKFRDEKHIRSMVAIWADMFSEDDAGLVALAVKEHISTSKWPPSIAEIREIMTRIAHPDIIPPDEAWEVVSKYLDTEGEYNHGDIYRALPRTIAEAVDSIGYGQLYAMHVAYARGHAAKAGLDRVAFMQAYEDKVDATRKPPPENRGGQRRARRRNPQPHRGSEPAVRGAAGSLPATCGAQRPPRPGRRRGRGSEAPRGARKKGS